MYSTKFQVTQAHLLQAQQERRQILSELEQVKQLQMQLQCQLEQVASLVKVLEGLQLFDPAILQTQWEIQAQLIQAQEERFQNIGSELAPLPSQLPQAQAALSQSFLSESSQVAEKIALEVVPSSNSIATLTSKQDQLIAVKSVDYTKLEDLLATNQWKEADRETKLLMFKIANIEPQGKFAQEHFSNFPCEYLHNIDQLWLEYSKGHFGFTIQKQIFEKVGGKPGVDDYKAYCRFGEEVGWLVKNHWLSDPDLKFSLNVRRGHLPLAPFASLMQGIRCKKIYFCDFFSRLKTCNL